EIYNHCEIRQQLYALGYIFQTDTDTEILVHGYQEWGKEVLNRLDGMFAFIIYDSKKNHFLAARDHIGIKPLYYLYDEEVYYIASEMKALLFLNKDIQILKPGYFLTKNGEEEYFRLAVQQLEEINEEQIISTFKELLFSAVHKMVQTDLPIGVIFSGGLDSAAVLSIAKRYQPDIIAFTAGLKGSSDIEISRRYCQENNIPQYIAHLSIDDVIQDLPEAIYYAETFEMIDVMDFCITSSAMRLAHKAGIKVVLGGDGSDEILAGYQLFKTHPDPVHLMTYRLSNLHRTDLQRADRSSMRHSIEARVPFLDKAFLNFAYNVPMTLKLRQETEKWILREALKDLLPAYIAWRPKIRMAEGAGLQAQLLEFVSKQPVSIDAATLANLKLNPIEAYFLELYLQMGYPVPHERYKQASLDFAR
ncbi:MAG TPA: asparagine synthase-related protein, partial [Ktedonobacteraceae bacterium]|nr:asparagine synthase-related protein [Ktedonobacteraceae bacterium]